MSEFLVSSEQENTNTLDPILLQKLIDCTDDTWYTYWLNFVAHHIKYHAALLWVDEKCSGKLAAIELRPENTPYQELLQSAAQQAHCEKHPIISPTGENHYVAAWPYIFEDQVLAVITLILPTQDQTGLTKQLTLLEWCATWLELRLMREKLSQNNQRTLKQQTLLDGFVTILEQESFKASAMAFCNYTSRELNCERAVLAFEYQKEIEICCQSDSNEYVERLATMSLTKKAMMETLEQQESVMYPHREDKEQVNAAHHELCSYVGGSTVLSVPLVDKEVCFGVLLLERDEAEPFTEYERLRTEALANIVGLALEQKRQSQQSLSRLLSSTITHSFTTLLKPGYIGRKLTFITIAFLLAFFSLVKGEYLLSADATIEGAEIRSIVVPFDGFLEQSAVRAGDEIETGKLIASLDTRELRLQRMKWLSEQSRTRRQYEEALSKHDRSQVQIYSAQMERSKAELALVDFQIEQSSMTAPFNAIVVSGDQSQRIGSSVRQGEVLFELSPDNRYRLALFVNEFRINDIKKEQTGLLVLSAMSDKLVSFKIKQITPIAEPKDGESVYRVEAEILSNVSDLRPGLEGVAKVYIDDRLLISIWTRGFRDWLTMQWWRFWG